MLIVVVFFCSLKRMNSDRHRRLRLDEPTVHNMNFAHYIGYM